MAFLINPNLAHLLVVVGIMLLLLTHINPKSTRLKAGMLLCLAAAALEFVFLKVNPWAFLVLALSPLPFFLAVRQARSQNPLFLLTIIMLAISSVFLLWIRTTVRLLIWVWPDLCPRYVAQSSGLPPRVYEMQKARESAVTPTAWLG
jgi:hypothetical protein